MRIKVPVTIHVNIEFGIHFGMDKVESFIHKKHKVPESLKRKEFDNLERERKEFEDLNKESLELAVVKLNESGLVEKRIKLPNKRLIAEFMTAAEIADGKADRSGMVLPDEVVKVYNNLCQNSNVCKTRYSYPPDRLEMNSTEGRKSHKEFTNLVTEQAKKVLERYLIDVTYQFSRRPVPKAQGWGSSRWFRFAGFDIQKHVVIDLK